jgi:hypothetical protein
MPRTSQDTITRRQKTLTINTFSQKLVEPLSRANIYREIRLRLYGTLTYAAAANNAAATLGRGDEWSLIERVDIVKNGSDVIRSFTGAQLKIWNRIWYGTLPRISPFLGDGATAAPAFDSTLIIPFWMPRSFYPLDTALDSSRLSDFRIEVTVASAAGVTSGATPPTAVNANLDISSYESFGLTLENTDLRIYSIQEVLGAANQQLQIPLPVNAVYRSFLINFAASGLSTAADIAPFTRTNNGNYLTAAGIQNVKLQSGPTVFRDDNAAVLLEYHRFKTDTVREINPNAAQTGVPSVLLPSFVNGGRSANLNEDAWLYLDMVQDGYGTEAIDSYGWTELYLELNVAGAGTVTVMPMQMYPPRGKPAA